MLKAIPLLASLIILTSITSLAAQDASDNAWPVQERCIGNPVSPPKDWTYNGTILMTGSSGIYGVNAAWETPRVLNFLNDNDLWGGALSPDGQWYASPRGNFTITETYNGITEIDELRVSSVDGQRNHFYRLPVDRSEYVFYQYTHAQVYWSDNKTFLYANTQFSPFSDEIADWPMPEYAFDGQPNLRFYFAPNWTRWIFIGHDGKNHFSWKLSDLTQNKVLDTLNIESPIAWKPDSSEYMATVSDDADIPTYSLDLFDHDGTHIETIFSVPAKQQPGMFTLGWSDDNRYFAFITFDMYISPEGKAYPLSHYYNTQNNLYIADTQNKIVFDTCKAIGEGLAWSLDATGDELAFLAPGEGLKDVFILNLENYTLYPIARHIVSYNRRIYQGSNAAYDGIIGWRDN